MDDLDALVAAAKRLREIDPAFYRRILATCRAYVATFDGEVESPEVWQSRVMEMREGKPRGSA